MIIFDPTACNLETKFLRSKDTHFLSTHAHTSIYGAGTHVACGVVNKTTTNPSNRVDDHSVDYPRCLYDFRTAAVSMRLAWALITVSCDWRVPSVVGTSVNFRLSATLIIHHSCYPPSERISLIRFMGSFVYPPPLIIRIRSDSRELTVYIGLCYSECSRRMV